MTMFSAACYQFVKSVGKNTLIPVPTIDEKDKIKPLQLVIKTNKREYFFFHKTKHRPTDFQITDVLRNPSTLEVTTENETELANYDRTTNLSLKGKFGADISKEFFDLELNAEDYITVKIDFGKVLKKEVKVPDLMSQINKRSINFDHPYIRQVMSDSRKVLCVITGVAYLDKTGTIHRETKWDASASVTSKLVRGTLPSAEGEYDKGRDLTLAAGTPVAYSVHELNVDKSSGAIQIVLAEGKSGGFKAGFSYDQVDGACTADTLDIENRMSLEPNFSSPLEVFEPLISLPEDDRREITANLLCLLENPRDLSTLADLLERLVQQSVSAEGAEVNFVSSTETVQNVLKRAGIVLKDNKVYPSSSEDSTMLVCLCQFFDAAEDIDDDVLILITKCAPDIAAPLLNVLQYGIKGQKVTDTNIVEKFTCDPEASHFQLLKQLQFRFEDNEIKAPIELPYSIDEIYWVLTALWGQKS